MTETAECKYDERCTGHTHPTCGATEGCKGAGPDIRFAGHRKEPKAGGGDVLRIDFRCLKCEAEFHKIVG